MVCPRARRGGRSLKLKKVNYRELNAKQKELFNFQKLAAVMADYGFNCIRLSDDWQGADFLAYHKDGAETLKAQLKSRMTIKKEYMGKDLFLAVPVDGSWYLVEHYLLVSIIGRYSTWLESETWKTDGTYSSAKHGVAIRSALQGYTID